MIQEKTEVATKFEEVKCVALGEDIADGEVVEVIEEQSKTDTEKIKALEQHVYHLTNSLDNLFMMVKNLRDDINKEEDRGIQNVIEKKKKENRIEIPEGTVLTGKTKGLSYFLQVKKGGFNVGVTRYDSLSAAAEGVSGVRRSGWTFWCLPDGKTVKEAFKS